MTDCIRRQNGADEDLAAFCAAQLRAEESALTVALPLVRAAQAAFAARDLASFVAALAGHEKSLKVMADINGRRRHFRAALARRLGGEARQVTWARAMAELPRETQAGLTEVVSRVRGLVEELAALSYALSIQLRIYLDAYRRLLRDVTNTGAASGRYGRAGIAEAHEYRSLIQIRG